MATTQLEPKIEPGRILRPVELGIWSSMADGFVGSPYDLRAMAIDSVVASPGYQKLAWGTSADSLEDFANEAYSKENQPYLDAGCGTMRFTAPVYARVELTMTAVDPSLGKLKRAQDRLSAIKIDSINRIALVQADLTDLPFPDGYYETVACFNQLHHYADGGRLLDSLIRVLQPGGELYITSLVSVDRPIGEKYGQFLLERGEIAAWRHLDEVAALIGSRLHLVSSWTEGNTAFAWAVKPL